MGNSQIPAYSLVLCLLAACALAAADSGAEEGFAESDVKTELLASLPDFVDWPQVDEQPTTAFELCLILDDPDTGSTAFFETTTIKGRRVHAVRHDAESSTDGCELLFVSATNEAALAARVEQLSGAGILTVGETESFVENGGILALVLEEGHVSVVVNPATAQRHGFRLDSNLLQISRLVEHKP